MRITARSGVLSGPEGLTPPAPFITVDDKEGRALIRSGIAVAFDGDVPAETPSFVLTDLQIGADVSFAEDHVLVQILVDGAAHGAPIVTALPVADAPLALLGTDAWPAVVPIGDHGVILGDVVRAACGDKPPAAWNDMSAEMRESMVAAEIYTLRRQLGRDPNTNEAPNAEQDGNDTLNGAGSDDTLSDEEKARLTNGGHPADLVEAFELIEADDLVKTGPRAGKPKVEAVKAIIEREVTAEQVDAAWDARAH